MRHSFAIAIALLFVTGLSHAQDDVVTFKTETVGAFVWGEDTLPGAVSSSVKDPVTGNEIRMLNHGGIYVSSRAGFETVRSGEEVKLLSFTATVVNNTESELSVRQGGTSVDGHLVLPLAVGLSKKGLGKKQRRQVWDLASMNCFSTGFLPNELFLSPTSSSAAFKVNPKRSLTLSFITKDPRYRSGLCSVVGCYPKETLRFSVTVNATEFVFVWPGKTMANCGR
jgi:hypothetical protein